MLLVDRLDRLGELRVGGHGSPVQVDARNHAAHRATRELDRGDVDGNDLAGLLDRRDLVGTEAAPGPPGHRHDVAPPALRGVSAELHRVAGEVTDLLLGQGDHLAAVDGQPFADLLAAVGVRDHLQRDQRDVGADAGEDVGVVHGNAVGVHRLEGHRLVVEVAAEPLQDMGVGPVAHRRVGHPRHVVEHHRPGPLEEDPVGLETGVVDDGLAAVLRLQHLQHVGAPLVAAVRGVHGVDGHVAARVGGQPVVREDAVRPGVVLVPEDVHPHAGVPEGLGQRVHLGQRLARRRVLGLARRDVALERVVGRRGRVGNESLRSDQDDRGRGLGTHGRRI